MLQWGKGGKNVLLISDTRNIGKEQRKEDFRSKGKNPVALGEWGALQMYLGKRGRDTMSAAALSRKVPGGKGGKRNLHAFAERGRTRRGRDNDSSKKKFDHW